MKALLALITDQVTGRTSSSKLRANLVCVISSIAVLKMAWAGSLTADFFLAYVAVAGADATASKYLSLKFGAAQPKNDAPDAKA